VRFVYNASDSVPLGWYRIGATDSLHVGDVVLARLPSDAAAMAARRGYLPERIPLVKRIGAMSPQQVCVRGGIVHIDGVAQATALAVDRLGRRLPVWRQCRALHVGELFLLSTTNPASFDSRYFGPVTTSAVIGRARPLWTWSTQ
jgi:conjugative transfer signal peptidase TraF